MDCSFFQLTNFPASQILLMSNMDMNKEVEQNLREKITKQTSAALQVVQELKYKFGTV